MKKITLQDIIRCPECNSDDCAMYRFVGVNLDSFGTGEHSAEYRCRDCAHEFGVTVLFDYSITEKL